MLPIARASLRGLEISLSLAREVPPDMGERPPVARPRVAAESSVAREFRAAPGRAKAAAADAGGWP